ncbi:hypothetical protein DNTS_002508 [Danionella cerebrum]|uniref:GTP-binding protein n=1 Tax=Danionella cerebrum TaxID=2873325 RepID=A0A553N2R8_9TELE|nr:hypothetical protein DNTS_002508 [Danionella translucida]
MREEVTKLKKVIMELEHTNEELMKSIAELQVPRTKVKKEICLDVFLQSEKYTYVYKMTLNTQKEGKEPLRRRASTPIPSSRQATRGDRDPSTDHYHPPLAQSASYHPGDKSLHSRANWSSDSESDSSGDECLYRVVLLGDHGVGKSSLANIFAGIQEKDAHKHIGEDTYERTLTVDGEETTLIVMDSWETEKQGRACAVMFDCKFIETSASLQHNVNELFEGIVRQIRLRRDSKETNERRRSVYKRKESITKKARRFLDRLVAKNNKKMALKVRSKSCHDLAVL